MIATPIFRLLCFIFGIFKVSQVYGDSTADLSAKYVSAGETHTCAILMDETLRCWGANESGQLGNGSLRTQAFPEAAPIDLGIDDRAQQVVAGNQVTCALLLSGHVKCWGRGMEGILGQSSTDQLNQPPETPLAFGQKVTHIELGPTHACAILEDGSVSCWGRNDMGQLGRKKVEMLAAPLPNSLKLGKARKAVQLALSYGSSCAFTDDKQVICWGHGYPGQAGIVLGNILETEPSFEPLILHQDREAAGLSAGKVHTCVLYRDGKSACWGAGYRGRLGSPEVETQKEFEGARWPGKFVQFQGIFKALTGGDLHTCGLDSKGKLYCWGAGDQGQLGAGKLDDLWVPPVQAVAFPKQRSVLQVSAGSFHSCAVLDDHSLFCWGRSFEGQLGYGPRGDYSFPPKKSIDIRARVKDISIHRTHSCVLLDDQSARCWGKGVDGRLGTGDNRSLRLPPEQAIKFENQRKVLEIAAGENHSCARLEDLSVVCWGRSSHGQLGDGEKPADKLYVRTRPGSPIGFPGGLKSDKIALGSNFSCALLQDKSVRCWGAGEQGQLGQGKRQNSNKPGDAVKFPKRRVVRDIALGGSHACAVFDDGSLACWGAGSAGQLGLGKKQNVATPGLVPLGSHEYVEAVTLGAEHSCVLLKGGQVKCWGEGRFGQLGTGPGRAEDRSKAPKVAIDFGQGAQVIQIAAGAHHTCALLRDGAVKCWGQGQFGQLGHGNTINYGSPRAAVELSEPAAKVVTGDFHSCALLKSASVTCWGSYDGVGYPEPPPVLAPLERAVGFVPLTW